MTKQEEIKGGIKYFIAKGGDWDTIVGNIFSYLHSRGVVIRVDRDTPFSKYVDGIFNSKKKSQRKEAWAKNDIYETAQIDMLNAGYVAVESLIKEV